MESLYQSIPMELWPDEYLPDDYKGPSVGPIGVIMGKIFAVEYAHRLAAVHVST